MGYTVNQRNISFFGLNCVEALVPLYQKHDFKTYAIDEFYKYTASNPNPANHNQALNKVIGLNAIDE